MYKQYRMLVVLFISIFVNLLLLFNNVFAQPTVQLVMDPPTKIIRIDSSLQQVWIIARTNEGNLQLEWNIDGPGEFKVDKGGVGGIYNVPDSIDGSSAEVTIAVTTTNNRGETATDSVTFTLESIPPTPTPTPIPISIRQVHLKDAENSIIEPTYSVKPGEIVTIVVNITKPSDSDVEVKYSAIYGKVASHQQGIAYTAPDKPDSRDIVTVKVVNKVTGKVITIPKVIKIKIIGTPR